MNFEFVSTHRNRTLWYNPCLFEVPWSGSGQSSGLNAVDPISNQAPIVLWTGQNIAINSTVVSQTNENVVVSAPANSFSQLTNFYQGAGLKGPLGSSFRINGYKFLSQNGGLDYVQLDVVGSGVQVGDAVVVQVINVPNTLFVPTGSDSSNAYVGKYLYNETRGQSTLITGYDSVFHKVIASIPGTWALSDQFNVRSQLPSIGNTALGPGNTTTTLNLTGLNYVYPGDFIRLVSTNEVSKIISFDLTTSKATISPPFSIVAPPGTIIEIMTQTSDNYRTLAYAGTAVGQQEQVAYDISLSSASIPNTLIKNGSGGYASDYPFLYVELYDTNYPSQNNLFSNNHANKSYFKVTLPTGQLFKRNEKFSKFTGDQSHKTIRFRPTSNFRVAWRLPSEEIIEFEEDDTQSPQAPNPGLQTAVKFNLRRF